MNVGGLCRARHCVWRKKSSGTASERQAPLCKKAGAFAKQKGRQTLVNQHDPKLSKAVARDMVRLGGLRKANKQTRRQRRTHKK